MTLTMELKGKEGHHCLLNHIMMTSMDHHHGQAVNEILVPWPVKSTTPGFGGSHLGPRILKILLSSGSDAGVD